MKTAIVTLAALLGASGAVAAQDDRDRKLDELHKEFDRAMKTLQQRFDAERQRIESEFKAARERLLEKKGERKEGERRDEGRPRTTEEFLERIWERLDHLERRLDQELPRFGFKDAPFRSMPRFEFKDFDKQLDQFKDLAPRLRELLPQLKDKEFKFKFRRDDSDRDEPRKDEPKKERKEPKGDRKGPHSDDHSDY